LSGAILVVCVLTKLDTHHVWIFASDQIRRAAQGAAKRLRHNAWDKDAPVQHVGKEMARDGKVNAHRSRFAKRDVI